MTAADFTFVAQLLRDRTAIVLEPGKEYLLVSRLTPDLTANDTTPNPFNFTSQTNVPRSSVRTSNPTLISGLIGSASIYADGQLGSSYCISSASGCTCDVTAGPLAGGFSSTVGGVANAINIIDGEVTNLAVGEVEERL